MGQTFLQTKDGGLVAVARIERIYPGRPAYAVAASGKIELAQPFQEVAMQLGPVVPSAAGWRLAVAIDEPDGSYSVLLYAHVVAWRIPPYGDPVPICADGTEDSANEWAVVDPSGVFHDPSGHYQDGAAWLVNLADSARLDRERVAASA